MTPANYATRPLKPTLMLVTNNSASTLPTAETWFSAVSSIPATNKVPSLKLQAAIAKLNRLLG